MNSNERKALSDLSRSVRVVVDILKRGQDPMEEQRAKAMMHSVGEALLSVFRIHCRESEDRRRQKNES